jgi:glutathione peroxidase
MTIRQRLYKSVYPFWMFFQKLNDRKKKIRFNEGSKKPMLSFYDLNSILNDGNKFSFEQLRGKKVLLVNTASDCLYTNQYKELEKLYQQYHNQLIILGFPSNDFGRQEKGDDNNIAEFCKMNFNISFLLMKKTVIRKRSYQNEIYQWLTDATKNGWNDKPPEWNFSKYLVNEEGVLTYYFSPEISPLSKDILNAIS